MTCTHIPNHFYNNSVSLAACYVILYALVSMEVSLKAESSSRVLNDKFVWDRSYTCTAFKVLVKQFSVADKYFMVVYCLVNLWKPFLYLFMINCIRYSVTVQYLKYLIFVLYNVLINIPLIQITTCSAIWGNATLPMA